MGWRDGPNGFENLKKKEAEICLVVVYGLIVHFQNTGCWSMLQIRFGKMVTRIA